jgi:hypothetical protein
MSTPTGAPIETPLYMEKSLYDMVVKYLDEKPYKISKPIRKSIKPVDHPTPGSGETQTVYSLPRASALLLLNHVMNKEEIVMTYLFLRAGFERTLTMDREIANKLAEQKAQRTELPVAESSGPTIEPVGEPVGEPVAESAGVPGVPGTVNPQ